MSQNHGPRAGRAKIALSLTSEAKKKERTEGGGRGKKNR